MRCLWQQIPSTVVSELLARHTTHGVVLDTEHSSWNNETIYNCIQVVKLSGKSCYVRIAEVNKSLIKICLDADADGIILSNCDTTEQATQFKDLMYYPPHGSRGLGLTRQNNWGEDEGLVWSRPLSIVQIETRQSIYNLEEIKEVGFDYYLIGPYDLSMSVGFPGDFENSRFKELIKIFESEITEDKRAIHIPKDVDKHIQKYVDYGLVAVGMDSTDLIKAIRENVNA